MKRRSVGVTVIAAAMAALVLSACTTANPGQAAVVGDVKISDETIADQMRSLNGLMGQPADTPNVELARTLVSYNIGYELIRATAERLQVTVPQSQLDQVYNQQLQQVGGEEQLKQAAAQQGVPPESLRRDLESQLLASAIVTRVAPETDPQAGQAVLVEEVRKVAESVPVDVAPKYGAWDSAQLQIVPNPDAVSRPAEEPAPALPVP